jgi:hypothetical protein
MSFVMGLRNLPEHGLIPYLTSIFKSNSELRYSIAFNTYYTFVFGVFATIRTINEATQDWNVILVSLNPLPGTLAGWYDYAPLLRLNKFAPYTLHGQIFNMGLTFTCLFFSFIGLIFSFFEKIIRKFLIENQRGISLIIVLLLSLFLFYSFEYYLRSAFRYIYYAYFILILYLVLRQLFKTIKAKAK